MTSVNFEPGHTVSHFRIEKLLGEGGMGAVYLAEDLTLSRRVAIKFMHRSLLVQKNKAASAGLEERFKREAKSAAAINHPNLAQIYEANFDSDNWFIAMEYIDGSSLYDLLSKGKEFTIKEIVNVCRQVVSGLDFAWENYKIVHRDIKPHNIMLTNSQLVKIVDLGLAKPIMGEETDYALPDLTCAGTPIGTPQYMAPEQATGQKDITFLVDIYALGATLYEILSGKKAFSGSTAPMIYMAQVQKKYAPLNELKKGIPEPLTELIHSMLEPNPEERIASYMTILEALTQIEEQPDINRSSSVLVKNLNRPLSTMHGQLSSKTVGMDQSIYHPVDMLIKNRYRILRPIGKSRAGIVYHCMDKQSGVECAVKSIFPGREYPEHEMPRVFANFQRLMNYSHPNLVQIRDLQLDKDTGELFVVMELLMGRDLRDYTHHLKNQTNGVTVKTIFPVFMRIAKALDSVCKTHNVIHHDLIPEKIYLLNNDTQVKLLDFSITYPTTEDLHSIKSEDYFKFPLATPDYMSPELWQRKPVSRQSDQYSLAVIIYEMLAEKLPFWLKDPITDSNSSGKNGVGSDTLLFHEQQLRNLYNRVLSEAPGLLLSLNRHENKALLKALSKDPHSRFQSCEDFINALSKRSALPEVVKMPLLSSVALVILGTLAYVLFIRNPTEKQNIEPDPTPFKPEGNSAKIEDHRINRQIEASRLKVECNNLHASLLGSTIDSDTLAQFDTALKDADKNFERGNYEDSIIHYTTAISFANNFLKKEDKVPDSDSRPLKQEAAIYRERMQEVRQNFAKNNTFNSLLEELDSMINQANELCDKEDYTQAIIGYKNSEEWVKNLRKQRTQAVELKQKLEQLRKEYLGNGTLASKLPELDSRIEQANNLFEKGKFRLSREEYETAITWDQDIRNKKDEASNLKKELQELHQEFSEDQILASRLPELADVKTNADNFFNKGDYSLAIEEYKKMIDTGRTIEDRVKQERKVKAVTLEKEADSLRSQLKKYKRLSPEIMEKVVKLDVSLSLAYEALKKEEFKAALEHYNKAILDGKGILDLAEGKFQANKGKNFTDPKVGMEFVWIKPRDIWVGKYEVTNGEYRKFKKTHNSKKSMGFSLNKDRQPVIEVSYYEAIAYCEWMNAVSLKEIKAPNGYAFRLPSREEWEAIARCGKERLYPWGNEWPPKYGNFGNQEVFPGIWDLEGYSDEFPVTCPVEKSGKNEWNIYGVAGNVWEWTSGLQNEKRAVLGGAWTEIKRPSLVITLQALAEMDKSYDNIGFRVVLAPLDK